MINLKEGLSVGYHFKYSKRSQFKTEKISDIKSNGEFSLSISNSENLELVFRNKSYSTNMTSDPLVFSPVKLSYNSESNFFVIKNKESIKMQWDKHKEKYRNPKNLSMIMVVERLYFHILFGLEYDLLSSSAYIPFFSNFYDRDFNEDYVIHGMSWVLTPLSIPVKIQYKLQHQQKNLIFLAGLVSLDEEKLSELIADKNFQQRAKSYHFTKNFTIDSDIKVVYDLDTGYLVSSNFKIKISGKDEGLEDEISFQLNQEEAGHTEEQAFKSFILE